MLTDGCPCLISQALAAQLLAFAMAGYLFSLGHIVAAWWFICFSIMVIE